MKKLLCVILSLGILLSLAGCSLFGNEQSNPEETFPPMEKMQTDFNTVGMITEDTTPYYSDRNDLLYTLLAHFRGSRTRVGFIHIPYSAEQGKEPSMDLEHMIRGLTVAIQHID